MWPSEVARAQFQISGARVFGFNSRMSLPVRLLVAGILLLVLPLAQAADAPRWWKGNLHTHTLWSDGDDYPEMVVEWYKSSGYHFLALSDHNVLLEGTKWVELLGPTRRGPRVDYRAGGMVFERYLARFGRPWVETREVEGQPEVRLKALHEFRSIFEEADKFLLLPAEEITGRWTDDSVAGQPPLSGPVHLGAINVREPIEPRTGRDALSIMQDAVNAVLAQRERTGQPMFPHLNHPNYRWGVTPEELMRVQGEKFFEIYNGHSGVRNAGDATHLSTEKMWDVVLAHRLTELKLEPMFGIATDDAHHYHTIQLGQENAGRGWVVVRAASLTPEALIAAMEAGDFYASTGVTLAQVSREGATLTVEVRAEAGVDYTIQFVGTPRDFDRRSELMPAVPGTRPHRRYSDEVGRVLAEVKGALASYTLRAGDLYVRAKIVSTKPKPNASSPDEVECAWTQPLVASGGP
ncbi:MAG: hypothetical protein C0518_02730 [Opitutus sp.]|nr:hypothetical protein [Opitutus sp.]